MRIFPLCLWIYPTFSYLLVLNFSTYPQPRFHFFQFFLMFENAVDTNYVVALQYDPIHHWWGLHGITHDTNCKEWKQNKHIYTKSLPVIKASIFNVYSVHVLTPFSEHSYSSLCTRIHSKVCSSDVTTILTKFWDAQEFILYCIDKWNDKRETLPRT